MDAGKLVLIVDDDALTRQALASLLDGAGYLVACAANGREGLDLMRSVEPRLVILDLNMPVMSGRCFRSQQLADPDLAGVPVFLISGEPGLAGAAAELGAVGHLSKPFDLAELAGAVARLAGGVASGPGG
jgi:two-component system chemotaxis response regulator CheY